MFTDVVRLFARQDNEVAPRVANVQWNIEGDNIVISYDLLGEKDEKYEVSVSFLKEDDPGFRIVPQTISGDAGTGYFAGKGKSILWEFIRDFPAGFQGEGYYVEVTVKPAPADRTWLYYTLGAAALAGGLVAIIVGSRQSGGSSSELPMPPDRPR